MYLIFDTETTGLPRNYNAPITETENWPRMVQLAWQMHDDLGNLIEVHDYIVYPEGYDIPFNAAKIHGITTERARAEGSPLAEVLAHFNDALKKSRYAVGHNIGFDMNIVGCEYVRAGSETTLQNKIVLDTCTEQTAILCQLPGGKGGKFKLPNLAELHDKLFNESFDEAHNAAFDVEATARVFLELLRQRHFTESDLQAGEGYLTKFINHNPKPFKLIGLASAPAKEKRMDAMESLVNNETDRTTHDVSHLPFAHLHCHTQFSVLQSTTEVDAMVKKASADGMSGLAITDMSNLMAAFQFNKAILSLPSNAEVHVHNKKVWKGEIAEEMKPYPLKGVIGCEFNVCKNHQDRSAKDNGHVLVALAKNKTGYHNLAKLSSAAHIDGFYYVPRIDKELLLKHKDGLIITTGSTQGEVPYLILNVGESQAEEAMLWYKSHFGDDFYLELNRHGLDDENHVNEVLIRLGRKHNIKFFAANNNYYLDKENAQAHEVLMCIKDGEKISTPIGRGRGYRDGLPNHEFYFKTKEEMQTLFSDLPEALQTIQEILDKVEVYELSREVLLPKFEIPTEFIDPQDEIDGQKRGENAYLRHLTYLGAKKRFGTITPEIQERLDFELETIAKTGYPGYFLIVQDFCEASRQMGVSVGPGRGSAAGSAVAYCIGITNVDPIKYDLLFERFLNPERVSLPDIDIDFADDGRDKVIKYVIDKYGSSQVAQIITYQSMAAKTSIRDAARVLELPLQESDRLAKYVPDFTSLKDIVNKEENELRQKFNGDDADNVLALKQTTYGNDLAATTIKQAQMIEGSIRGTGIHACGIIITPSDIRELIPVGVAKDSPMWVTQFDNSVVESAGLLKMDFLGLATLTIIENARKIIKERHGIDINPDDIPLDDQKTYELFQRGETTGIFQYESDGMQKYMRELKPTTFADLIAMNALYRPGPLDYIPKFIARKHGQEPITYDLEDMEEYLAETYGITVYQEQVMLLSQKLAGFTKGEADVLRKAMGKKQRDVLDKMKPKFIKQAMEKGHPEKVLEKVWKDWEAFASYAFNKSHSTCYALVAYQTAYLKANHPAEYMAAVLSNNMINLAKITPVMEECKRMGLRVLGPDVNESVYTFTVNADGHIRFGLGGMRGIGEAVVEQIVEERTAAGKYTGIFNFVSRLGQKVVNKRVLESLALGGAFDGFPNEHRAAYFHEESDGKVFLEKVIAFATKNRSAEESSQVSLFDMSDEVNLPEPPLPQVQPWPRMVALRKEKEINGMYLSSHPLDEYGYEIRFFVKNNLTDLLNLERMMGQELSFGAIVTSAQHKTAQNGNGWGIFKVEDYSGDYEFRLFRENYLKFRHVLDLEQMVWVRGRVMERFKNVGDLKVRELNFEVSKVNLMSEVFEQASKQIDLKIPLEHTDEKLAEQLLNLLKKHKGKKRIRFRVVYADNSLEVNFLPKKLHIDITSELVAELLKIPHLQLLVT